jgi:two-component system, cell cycle response regulator
MTEKKTEGRDSTKELVPTSLGLVPSLSSALVVVHGSEADLGVHVLLEGPATIGREPGLELTLNAEGVSRKHCRVFGKAKSWFVEDLGSTNGTFVNGERVRKRRRLKAGDRLYLGRCVIKFTGADELEVGFHARMDELAGSDELTGLPSKRRFDAALLLAVKDAAATRSPLALLAVDLDGLKQVNDRFGHAVGAHTIHVVGRLLAEVIGAEGLACRFGGDEFVAFLRGKDKAGGCAVAERIRAGLAATKVEKDGARVEPTLSVGVASFPDSAQTAEELFLRADEALYRAKRAGRDRVET